ncbi:MAG: hypothetical protein LBV44_09625 [Methylobacillus sp.]|jgi:hypothetical protein|nr:hypothetical protein [Methylobacillus sp.]
MTDTKFITHAMLAQLVEDKVMCSVDVVAQHNGWKVNVRYGATRRTLAAKRGIARTFRKFETLIAYLGELGISIFDVDAAAYDPQALKASRSRLDSSQRMRAILGVKPHVDRARETVRV